MLYCDGTSVSCDNRAQSTTDVLREYLLEDVDRGAGFWHGCRRQREDEQRVSTTATCTRFIIVLSQTLSTRGPDHHAQASARSPESVSALGLEFCEDRCIRERGRSRRDGLGAFPQLTTLSLSVEMLRRASAPVRSESWRSSILRLAAPLAHRSMRGNNPLSSGDQTVPRHQNPASHAAATVPEKA